MPLPAARLHPGLLLGVLALSAGTPAAVGCDHESCDCPTASASVTVLDQATGQPIVGTVTFTDESPNEGITSLGAYSACSSPVDARPLDGGVAFACTGVWNVGDFAATGVHQISVSAPGYAATTIDVTVDAGTEVGCMCLFTTTGQTQTVSLAHT